MVGEKAGLLSTMGSFRRLVLLCSLCLGSLAYVRSMSAEDADALMAEGKYEEAGIAYLAQLLDGSPPPGFNLEETFKKYTQTYVRRGRPLGGYIEIAKLYLQQGDANGAKNFLGSALAASDQSLKHKEPPWDVDVDAAEANHLGSVLATSPTEALTRLHMAVQLDPTNAAYNYEWGSRLFSQGNYEDALHYIENSYKYNNDMWISFATSMYLRTRVCDWRKYKSNMAKLLDMIEKELEYFEEQRLLHGIVSPHSDRKRLHGGFFVDPHMLLAMPFHPKLKLGVAREHAYLERKVQLKAHNRDAPYHHVPSDYQNVGRIKVAYVSADFRLKATSYLIHKMFQFHDRSKFEVYCIANTPNSAQKERDALGIDWRATIEQDVEHFVDVSGRSEVEVATLIREELGIHILVDMDGFSNNGLRLRSLFPLQVAPIQVAMLVYGNDWCAFYAVYRIR